jgi:hypothetical protein
MKRLIMFIAVTALLLTGCRSTQEQQAAVPAASNTPQVPAVAESLPNPLFFDSEQEFIDEIKSVRQDKNNFASLEETYKLSEITEFYKPKKVIDGFEFDSIMMKDIYITYNYYDGTSLTSFCWRKSYSPDTYLDGRMSYGNMPPKVVEHNGIEYVFYGQKNDETGVQNNHVILWVQDHKCFEVFIPTRYDLEDIFAFCDAQAVQVE